MKALKRINFFDEVEIKENSVYIVKKVKGVMPLSSDSLKGDTLDDTLNNVLDDINKYSKNDGITWYVISKDFEFIYDIANNTLKIRVENRKWVVVEWSIREYYKDSKMTLPLTKNLVLRAAYDNNDIIELQSTYSPHISIRRIGEVFEVKEQNQKPSMRFKDKDKIEEFFTLVERIKNSEGFIDDRYNTLYDFLSKLVNKLNIKNIEFKDL